MLQENQYPGVACDIPSHLYTFSFDPNPNWTQYFASGGEIQEYFQRFADKHNLRKYMKLSTKVIEARFSAHEGLWNIELEDLKSGTRTTDWAHVLINGTGVLNSWKWPDIPGLHDFQGPLIHSAKWDHEVDFTDKTIGVIGTGTSSVQIIPQLQKTCKKISVFMRSPTWVSPPFGSGVMEKHLTKGAPVSASQRQYDFTEFDRKRFREDPAYHLQFRKEIEAEINGLFGLYRQNSEMSRFYKGLIEKEMHRYAVPDTLVESLKLINS
ncbi:hypothetical protein LTS07_003445 [Exophiala sideris]|uniref:Uncharacterized protein n=1 Tax=Exophiala sideris TaxID=1016849 RepID=A0ABR0JJ46_9EURO|nr:hypothetical protein LTS07_003445 [Exophiala sideris]KAK5042820.1 hypothetical protein LTR13_001668 [Exophiala sideris]KAK5065903.1 hypothetical protein LTR69_003453 [Exophiala sideris]